MNRSRPPEIPGHSVSRTPLAGGSTSQSAQGRWPFALVLLALGLAVQAAEPRDPYGGWPGVRARATSFFRTEQVEGVWWLITPDSPGFFSKGVNHVQYNGDPSPALGYSPYQRAVAAKYGSAAKWAEASIARMRGWGLNTVGAWSSREAYEQRLPYAFLAGLGEGAGAEWQFGKAADSGLPNTRGAGKALWTQQERAEHFDRYVTGLARLPFLVGYHWFQYGGQPAEGRCDGENSNYGLVNLRDEPWTELVTRFQTVNEQLEETHRRPTTKEGR